MQPSLARCCRRATQGYITIIRGFATSLPPRARPGGAKFPRSNELANRVYNTIRYWPTLTPPWVAGARRSWRSLWGGKGGAPAAEVRPGARQGAPWGALARARAHLSALWCAPVRTLARFGAYRGAPCRASARAAARRGAPEARWRVVDMGVADIIISTVPITTTPRRRHWQRRCSYRMSP